MTRGQLDPEVVRRHLAALREALGNPAPARRTRRRGAACQCGPALDGRAGTLDILARVLRERLPELLEFSDRVEEYLGSN